jgi:nitrate reductase assembly molybdenum cofactor insertion protein NarJ
MRVPSSLFDDIATLLSYPGPETEAALTRLLTWSSAANTHQLFPGTHRCFRQFAIGVGVLSQTELEELYTRTFDINPSSSLEIGWHLYGEQYERGSFLVLMRGQLRERGIPEGEELPDHLTHVLRLFGRLADEERKVMIESCLRRGMDIMMEKWKDEDNPYRRCLDGVRALLDSLCPRHEGVIADV